MTNYRFFKQEDSQKFFEEYSVLGQEKVSEELENQIEEWDKEIEPNLKKENPFQEDFRLLRRAKLRFKISDNSLSEIQEDLKYFESVAQKTGETVDSTFWKKELQELKNPSETQELKELKEEIKKKKEQLKSKPKENQDEIKKEFQEIEQEIQTNKGKQKSKSKENQDEIKKKIKELQEKQKQLEVKEEKKRVENQKIARRLLQEQWEKLLEKKQLEWELKQLEEKRKRFLKKIQEWLKLLQNLQDTLSDISLEPGLLFDLSKGELSMSDIEQLKKWVQYISQDEGLKKLCDIMGRLRSAERSKRQELIQTTKKVEQFVPDINSKEEIVGVHLGRQIEYILPQELALLADEETSILFDMKYTEGRLMCFEMEGLQKKFYEIEEEKTIEVEEKEKMGPIIVCVDTSGSMQGSPETIAKALTLFLATRAIGQKRNCFLINFSTQIETLDLSGKMGISQAIQFLQRSFHGGTDASPALEHGLELMETENYKKADLLMISDFLMGDLPDRTKEKIELARKQKNKFYSLSIGSNLFLSERLQSIFDNEWTYDANSGTVQTLQEIGRTI